MLDICYIWIVKIPDRIIYVLTASREISSQAKQVIIKTAPKARSENERDILSRFHSQPCIRQLLDQTKDPPSLVLQHLDDSLLDASNKKTLTGLDVKFVAKRVLQALQALHEDGYTHTGKIVTFYTYT